MKYLSLSSHCTLKYRCVCDCGCFQDYTWTSIVLRTSHHEQSGVTQLQNICQKKRKKDLCLHDAHVWRSDQNASWEKARVIQAPCYSESLQSARWRDFRSEPSSTRRPRARTFVCIPAALKTLSLWKIGTASSQVCSGPPPPQNWQETVLPNPDDHLRTAKFW